MARQIHVQQHGSDFEIYSDAEQSNLLSVERAPFDVGPEHSLADARAWFEEWGYFKGADELVWIVK